MARHMGRMTSRDQNSEAVLEEMRGRNKLSLKLITTRSDQIAKIRFLFTILPSRLVSRYSRCTALAPLLTAHASTLVVGLVDG